MNNALLNKLKHARLKMVFYPVAMIIYTFVVLALFALAARFFAENINLALTNNSADIGAQSIKVDLETYSLVAKKRIRAEKEEAKATLPGKTELLFYEHPNEWVFQAVVLDVTKDGSIILDRTLLYPEEIGRAHV